MSKKPCDHCNSEVMSMGVASIRQDGGREGEARFELTLYGGDLILFQKQTKHSNPHFLVNYCPMCGRRIKKSEKGE